jgi:outer membrane protein insertion porin family
MVPEPLITPGGLVGTPAPLTDIMVNVQETQTGRLLIGAAVNSEAGLTGQIIIDEKNFDWRRVPTSWDDILNGTAFRGAGQGLRIEALPGSQVQRYLVQFSEPYLLDTRISFNISGFLYDRNYFDWDEQRLGGRIGFGYRVTPDLSLYAGLRLEDVTISDPRVVGVPELDEVVGDNELYGASFSVTQDTRDIPFAPTQGYYLELLFEQVFGTFDYSRGVIDFRRYFLIAERPDGSGRHVLGFASLMGISGSQTPIYDNFFAGGYSTLRGFEFRGASPVVDGVTVGGRLELLGRLEYRFPITADDMLNGVVFCDYGTVEQDIEINSEDYRVALGGGLRVSIPAMGPAPIALDFAVPVARADFDEVQNFSFFVGVSR